MAYRQLEGYEIESLLGYDLTISTSGDNEIIDATDQSDSTPFVGENSILQLSSVIVQGATSTKTLVKILSSGGDLLASGYVSDALPLVYCTPTELAASEGLTVNLGAANEHHVCVQYWKRQH